MDALMESIIEPIDKEIVARVATARRDIKDHKVSLRVTAFHIWYLLRIDQTLVDNEILVAFYEKLVRCEVETGGAYIESGDEDTLLTNALIARVWRELKHPIAHLEAYVCAEMHEKLPDNPSILWTISWPHPLAGCEEFDTHVYKGLQHTTVLSRRNIATSPSPTMMAVARQLDKLKDPLRMQALKQWEKMSKVDQSSYEMSQLSYYFNKAMGNKSDTRLLRCLGRANIYTWMAYTIYDNILDDEEGGQRLSLANYFHRQALQHYTRAMPGRISEKLIYDSFDKMDKANAWELHNTRVKVDAKNIYLRHIPIYEKGEILADRAIGHVVGPLLLALSDSHTNALTKGLRHYLIARQINDDTHDWLDDIYQGHLSYIVTDLLRGANIPLRTQPIQEVVNILQQYFWEEGLEKALYTVREHTTISRRYFSRAGMETQNSDFFTHTLESIEESVRTSLSDYHARKRLYDSIKSNQRG